VRPADHASALAAGGFAVKHTAELDRVRALPWRAPTTAEAEAWSDALTPIFTSGEGRLLPWQAYSIAECKACHGGWLALPVGTGKTLISYLLPTALEAERTLIIMKGASLVEKTHADFARLRRDGWRPPAQPIRVVTLEWLSTQKAHGYLDHYRPDLIVIDEADDLAATTNAAVRRLDRYVRARRQSGASLAVVAMTGTPIRKSLMGAWHLLCWCLDDGAPVPMAENEARMWSLALDDHDGRRPRLGPLGATVDDARESFRRRLAATPGVVIVDQDSCDAPLTVRVRLARECGETDARFDRFLVDGEDPGGIPVTDTLERYRLDGQIGLGLYSYWDPPPPDAWLEARRTFAKFCRGVIEASTSWSAPIDTEAQVVKRYRTHPAVTTWQAAKPLFDDAKHRRTAWFSRAGLDSALDWLRELDRPGVVWCGSVEYGRRLAREAGLAYYGRRGTTDDGASILQARPDRSFVASWQANKKGLNLQAWSRALVTMPPQSAKWLEQIVGRHHRQGQHSAVVVDVLATSGGSLDVFERAIREAQFARGMVTLTQKILRAEIVRAKPATTTSNAVRWARKGGA